jgi:hypothetical protein
MKVKTWYIYGNADEGTQKDPVMEPVKTMTYLKASKGMRLVNRVTQEERLSIVVEDDEADLWEELPGSSTCKQKH